MTSSETTKRAATHQFPCPSCGGGMTFHPSDETLTCPFCETKRAIESGFPHDVARDLDEALATYRASERTSRIFHCESCGGETELDPYSQANFCTFCGSSHVVIHEADEAVTPHAVMPFRTTRQEAERAFRTWVKKRWFAPTTLAQTHQLDRLQGMYIPYWTFGAETSTDFTVNVGIHYYVTETYRDSNGTMQTRQVQKTRWHVETGSYYETFQNVYVRANHRAFDKLLNKIEPFDFNDLRTYRDEYIAGFLAERYAIPLDEGWERAATTMDRAIENGIRYQVHGDIVHILSKRVDYDDRDYYHLLAPIWVASYRFNDKSYTFTMNGQTAQVAGSFPISWVKVVSTIVLSLFIALAVAYGLDLFEVLD